MTVNIDMWSFVMISCHILLLLVSQLITSGLHCKCL